jgi:hypothetical protein
MVTVVRPGSAGSGSSAVATSRCRPRDPGACPTPRSHPVQDVCCRIFSSPPVEHARFDLLRRRSPAAAPARGARLLPRRQADRRGTERLVSVRRVVQSSRQRRGGQRAGHGHLHELPAGGIDVVGGQQSLADQRGHEECHIRMESGRRAPMPRARTIGRGLGREIDGSLGARSDTPRCRRGELHVDELVEVPRNARAQQRVDPRQDSGVIGEETSAKPSAPPVVRELQGQIVPSPLDLDEDAAEWIVAERLRPCVWVLPGRWERRSPFTNQVAESHE